MNTANAPDCINVLGRLPFLITLCIDLDMIMHAATSNFFRRMVSSQSACVWDCQALKNIQVLTAH